MVDDLRGLFQPQWFYDSISRQRSVSARQAAVVRCHVKRNPLPSSPSQNPKSRLSISLQMKKIARRQQQQQQQQQEQDQLGNPRLGTGRGTGRNSRQSNDDSEGEEMPRRVTALRAAGWGGGDRPGWI